jgi:poly-beta-hydroxybutyrate-responsive repressor
VQPCLLLLLHEGPAHGYSLIENLKGFGFGEDPVDSSVVYRYMREMEEEGLVTSEWDTAAGAGPARRVYAITNEGDRALSWWVASLRETDRILHSFLEAYDRHMLEGTDEHHLPAAG